MEVPYSYKIVSKYDDLYYKTDKEKAEADARESAPSRAEREKKLKLNDSNYVNIYNQILAKQREYEQTIVDSVDRINFAQLDSLGKDIINLQTTYYPYDPTMLERNIKTAVNSINTLCGKSLLKKNEPLRRLVGQFIREMYLNYYKISNNYTQYKVIKDEYDKLSDPQKLIEDAKLADNASKLSLAKDDTGVANLTAAVKSLDDRIFKLGQKKIRDLPNTPQRPLPSIGVRPLPDDYEDIYDEIHNVPLALQNLQRQPAIEPAAPLIQDVSRPTAPRPPSESEMNVQRLEPANPIARPLLENIQQRPLLENRPRRPETNIGKMFYNAPEPQVLVTPQHQPPPSSLPPRQVDTSVNVNEREDVEIATINDEEIEDPPEPLTKNEMSDELVANKLKINNLEADKKSNVDIQNVKSVASIVAYCEGVNEYVREELSIAMANLEQEKRGLDRAKKDYTNFTGRKDKFENQAKKAENKDRSIYSIDELNKRYKADILRKKQIKVYLFNISILTLYIDKLKYALKYFDTANQKYIHDLNLLSSNGVTANINLGEINQLKRMAVDDIRRVIIPITLYQNFDMQQTGYVGVGKRKGGKATAVNYNKLPRNWNYGAQVAWNKDGIGMNYANEDYSTTGIGQIFESRTYKGQSPYLKNSILIDSEDDFDELQFIPKNNKSKEAPVMGGSVYTDYTNEAKKILNEFGDEPIESITLFRYPLQSGIQKALEVLTKGKSKENYDKLFHLGMIVKIKNTDILVEKNENITINRNIPHNADMEKMPVHVPHGLTLNDMLDDAHEDMGDEAFWGYEAFSTNCQNFLLNMMRSSGLLTNAEEDFIYQDLTQLIEDTPAFVRHLAKAATTTKAAINKVMGVGKKKSSKKSAKGGNVIYSVGVDYKAGKCSNKKVKFGSDKPKPKRKVGRQPKPKGKKMIL